ncbi:MAG: hypothetical protein A2487_14545 [Candidatus Raymondbacteria bacterium RifOxyC12_full_50_8]|uniref:Phosphatidylglycerol lysyltransferase C-terminal domain-containing protein n=1 Tax=Candidatus Raymondbacteria bacterium RIFOXYD12_FULL_49_13 TaxID=1817890 RepID=A0A1F7F639_UNCRA|nr:MAG: hypothetical protein A2248_03500 [Candidatus Raymondbacteria bacterium RIFOXYA2_FULL_49_16]OGJ99643.1 MAG: hypothetical protein A2350_16155 [Candidatus Raymondbacteria bacterium RifOxyB12_full_50_8]OGK02134.1 MAG: hypothetical protein A2519_18915 [Candidatus Raymondbacteria bacterium RIFOXYD12_FULL_49_13]OGK06861.1 MAG: hypothetical protein A2487_14545 [Candidatus Raymondbacteria bacterium RifOxyC12_full_50_8]OGP42519.1 MAG: hypothetical protein A2324_17535 [Candidatus Raymondbacteria b
MSQCGSCNKIPKTKSFLGSAFLPLEEQGWPILDTFLRAHPHPLSGYTLSCLAAWNATYQYQWVFPERGTLLISCLSPAENKRYLLQPLGLFSKESQKQVLAEAGALKYPLRIVGVDPAFVQAFPDFAAHFSVSNERDNYNYLYQTEDLAKLAGRRFSKKRNLIAQARKEYSWTVETLSDTTIGECRTVVKGAQSERHDAASPHLEQETLAVGDAVRLFPHLSFDGILIRIEGKPAAFSIFEPQNADTMVVHFEHALRAFKGLYQVVNQETARAIQERGYAHINREEDLGDPGLRQSKESYYPMRLAEALVLTFSS